MHIRTKLDTNSRTKKLDRQIVRYPISYTTRLPDAVYIAAHSRFGVLQREQIRQLRKERYASKDQH